MTTTTPTIEPLVLTKSQVAELLTVSEDSVTNLSRTGQLQAVKIGKHQRWRPNDVAAFVEKLGGETGGQHG